MLWREPDLTSLEQAQALAAQLDQKLRGFTAAYGDQCAKVAIQVCNPEGMSELLDPISTNLVADIVGRLKKDKPIQQAEFVFLMEACAPRYYHPGPSVLLAWDPDVAAVLTRRYPDRRAVIANAFWPSAEEIAAVIGHEKYGHGFLYLQTKLGRQLVHILSDAELYQAIVSRKAPAFVNAPWKRDFFEENDTWLPYLLGSVVVVEEGFSVWTQTKLLLCLEGQFASYAAYKLTRHPFSVPFKGLIPFLPYFQARGYPLLAERLFSPHKQGYDWIDDIYEQLGYSCLACVLHVIQLVMDVDFGIYKDPAGAIQVAVKQDRLLRYLRDGRPEYYLADQRLVAFRNLILQASADLEELRKNWPCRAAPPCGTPQDKSCYHFLDSLRERLPEWLQGSSDS